jgi:hypothetical protein
MFDSVILNAFLAFASMFVVDVINAIYIRHIQNDSALQTATTSAIIFLIHSVAIITYVGNNYYLIPAVMGGFAGAFVGVLINKKYIGVIQR